METLSSLSVHTSDLLLALAAVCSHSSKGSQGTRLQTGMNSSNTHTHTRARTELQVCHYKDFGFGPLNGSKP